MNKIDWERILINGELLEQIKNNSQKEMKVKTEVKGGLKE